VGEGESVFIGGEADTGLSGALGVELMKGGHYYDVPKVKSKRELTVQ